MQLSNVKLTCDYIKLCAEVGCKRVVYASSINEMETYEYLQSDDIDPAGGYIYGTGKLAAHLMGETVAKMTGVEFIPVIITNIYGVGENRADDLHRHPQAHPQRALLLHGGVSDVRLHLYHRCHQRHHRRGGKGKPFNRYYIGSGEPKPLRESCWKCGIWLTRRLKLGWGICPSRV